MKHIYVSQSWVDTAERSGLLRKCATSEVALPRCCTWSFAARVNNNVLIKGRHHNLR